MNNPETEDDKQTYSVEDLSQFTIADSFRNVKDGVWSLKRFEEWYEVHLGQTVEASIRFYEQVKKNHNLMVLHG